MTTQPPKLSDQMPERIMAQIPDSGQTTGVWHPTASGWAVEYVRADLAEEWKEKAWRYDQLCK